MRNVGIALSQATLQELAYSLGIEKNVADMTEAQKAQLRYIQLIKQSTEWQTDMAKTLMSPANATRILRQQFTLLARAIGNVLIPIVMTVIPYVMVLTQWLTKLANKLAKVLEKLFGIKLDFNYDREISGLGGIADGITDIGDAAGKSAKKLNTMLAPFDDLNVVQNELDKNGSGVGNLLSGGDLGVALPEYDALAGLTDKFKAKMDDAEENLKRILPIVAAIGGAFAVWKIGKSVADFMTWWSGLSGGGKSAARIALGVSLVITGGVLKFAGDKNVLSEETFTKGVAQQIGGSLLLGGGAAMITKNIAFGVLISSISLIHSGGVTASTGDDKNAITGLLEQVVGTLGVAGASFKVSGGNPYITLGVTALVVWSNVAFELKKLTDMKPTFEEISDAFNEILGGIPYKVGDWLGEVIIRIQDAWRDVKNWWNENVKPIFTKDFWKQKVDEMVKGVSEKWDELKTKTKEKWDGIKTTISDTWSSIKTGASDGLTSVKDTITTKWTESKDWLRDHIGGKEYWKEKFNSILDGATSILDDLKTKFSNWKATIKIPHIKWESNGFQTKGLVKKALEVLNLPTSLPKLKVDWYEEGGYPTSGDLFFANENGIPEMVGRIGNKTAVANQDQITTSITNAVVQGLAQSGINNQSKSPTTIYIGNKKVYEGYGDYIEGENDRYGTNMIRI